jgi:hypothetical protein
MKDPEEFISVLSILIAYFELEFSKLKDIQDKRKKLKNKNIDSSFLNDSSLKIKQTHVNRLVFRLQELEYYCEKFVDFSLSINSNPIEQNLSVVEKSRNILNRSKF